MLQIDLCHLCCGPRLSKPVVMLSFLLVMQAQQHALDEAAI